MQNIKPMRFPQYGLITVKNKPKTKKKKVITQALPKSMKGYVKVTDLAKALSMDKTNIAKLAADGWIVSKKFRGAVYVNEASAKTYLNLGDQLPIKPPSAPKPILPSEEGLNALGLMFGEARHNALNVLGAMLGGQKSDFNKMVPDVEEDFKDRDLGSKDAERAVTKSSLELEYLKERIKSQQIKNNIESERWLDAYEATTAVYTAINTMKESSFNLASSLPSLLINKDEHDMEQIILEEIKTVFNNIADTFSEFPGGLEL